MGRRRRLDSIDEVDVDLDPVAAGRGAYHGPDVLGRATPPADDAAQFPRRHVHLEDRAPAPLLGVDADSVRVVDERPHEVVEHG